MSDKKGLARTESKQSSIENSGSSRKKRDVKTLKFDKEPTRKVS